MQKHRYKVSFSITTILYVALFLVYVFALSEQFVVSQKEKDKTINLSLSQFVPEVIEVPQEELKPEEPIVEEEPEPEEVVKPPKKEIAKEEPVKEEPVVEKPVVEPKPIVKKVHKKVKPKKVVKKKKVHKKRVSHRKASSRRATSTRVNPNKKSLFLSKVRAKINRNKSYPRIAQKRGMQGVVKVKFTILKSGRVANISVRGPKVFHNSAKSAVKKAFPINVKNAPLNLPTTVNLSLRYTLH